jgi:phosphoesterase RecJ-like protein
MMTDTGNFSFNSNYPEMYQIVGELVALGVNKDEIYNRVFNSYSADRMRLMGYCLYQKMKIFPEHHTALIYLSRKELYRFNFQSGDAEGIVNLPLQIKDIHYSCFMREDKVNPTEVALAGGSKTKIKISLRSQGNRPVNIFAKEIFGGGGHANASGGEYYGPLPEAVQLFIDNYQQYFNL